ncbi:hypothetical protein LY78DRAFT_220103 [Colletotrichum sublineola]|nr:hypothetical protein LY78DRAFT_220103 [Colletotrichum sublineola]
MPTVGTFGSLSSPFLISPTRVSLDPLETGPATRCSWRTLGRLFLRGGPGTDVHSNVLLGFAGAESGAPRVSRYFSQTSGGYRAAAIVAAVGLDLGSQGSMALLSCHQHQTASPVVQQESPGREEIGER